MAGRRSVWNDPRVIDKAKAFVPATDEVWRLQRHQDRECRFFRHKVRGNPAPIGGSWQGLYIFAPDGTLLTRRNTLNPDAAMKLMDDGLEKWSSLAKEERKAADPAEYLPQHRWENSLPTDGLVLRSTLRDLPEKGIGPEGRGRWNRDHAWFNREEARSWMPEEISIRQKHTLPEPLALRLARFHVVDNVSGQEGPYAKADIEHAEIEIEVTAVDGNDATIHISGLFRSESDGVYKLGETDWRHFPSRTRGVDATLRGEATWNIEQRRFSAFRAAAHGQAWGGSGLNGRRGVTKEQPAAIGWYFELVDDDPRDRLAPAFIDVYNADWVIQPDA